MIIVADIGNSFLKMAHWDGQKITGYVRVRHRDVPIGEWQHPLREIGNTECEGVYVASVAGEAMDNELETWLSGRGHQRPVFLRATREACGVRNAYARPETLGIDRWCAVIAARSQHAGAVCVVDVGTAMTIDWVDATGQHRGGAIMPGPTMQVAALFSGTAKVREEAGVPQRLFADNTGDAVVSGACHACAALVGAAENLIIREGREAPKVFITGGEADRIIPLLETEAVSQPDLVLRGVICQARQLAG